MASIKDIKDSLEGVYRLDHPLFLQYRQDPRRGVQTALERRAKEIKAALAEDQRLEVMLAFEREFYQQGFELIAGVDEVGRGPLAGPVVAAAVILPKNCKIKGLNDSKKIPKSRHLQIYEEVKKEALAVGLGFIDQNLIDQVNIYQATKLAMLEAIKDLSTQPQALLLDAMELDLDLPQLSLIKGDARSLSIAAASIVAKVERDRLMAGYDQLYPGYDFAQNAGYGTKNHLSALDQLGISPIHRKTFEPIKSILEGQNEN